MRKRTPKNAAAPAHNPAPQGVVITPDMMRVVGLEDDQTIQGLSERLRNLSANVVHYRARVQELQIENADLKQQIEARKMADAIVGKAQQSKPAKAGA